MAIVTGHRLACQETCRHVLQSQLEIKGRRYLLLVFVDVRPTPAEVVTAYLTSKIGK